MTIVETTSDASVDNRAAAQAETNRGVARATGLLALGNISSRILGLVREIVLTNLFGASAAVDAFNAALLVPKGLFDLLIGGHVNSAIVPVLSEVQTVRGRDELWRVVSILASVITLMMVALVLALQLSAPWIIRAVFGGAEAAAQAQAAQLLRITAPALLFMGLFGVLSGALYALQRFTWPAFSTTVFNGVIVVVALLFTPMAQVMVSYIGGRVDWEVARPAGSIAIVALGWLGGSVAYLLLQLPGLRDARLRFTLDWRHPAIRQIGILYLPVIASLVLDVFVIRAVSYNLASQTGSGSIAYMNWATTLIQFPQGLVATAISLAILPTLAQQAAMLVNNNTSEVNYTGQFSETLGFGLRLAITLILPAAGGLFALAWPIIGLLFEHGAFTAADTEITAHALRLYLIGLPFAAVDLLLVYAFYARQDTLTPALIGLGSLLLYLAVAVALLPRYGLYSLMLADSAKHIVHALVSAAILNGRLGLLRWRSLALTALKSLAAAVLMAVFARFLLAETQKYISNGTLWGETAIVLICGAASAVVFIGLALLFGIEEWRWMLRWIRRII